MQHPRTPLITGATPLEPLHNLAKQLGIDLWVKRDDLAGTTLGGNKSRQLEYYLGAAQNIGADTVLITGAVQSNFVRTAAASALKCGMRTIVQLENRVPDRDDLYHSSGNVLLNQMLGAEIMYYPEGEDETGADAALRARADEERGLGYHPFVIPLGLGNPPLGALGYIRAAKEIMSQDLAFDYIIVASGSGLTHAGLLAGIHELSPHIKVIGSCVRRNAEKQRVRMRQVLQDLDVLLGSDERVPEDKLHIWDGALAPGYGQIGDAARSAMDAMAQHEGILLDPVYTAKVFAAIPALVKTGEIPQGARVLFVHTGGLAALFGYHRELVTPPKGNGAF